jgi:hypothetical protein
MWAEVKPAEFTDREQELAGDLADQSDFEVLKLVGVPEYRPYYAVQPASKMAEYGWDREMDYVLDDRYTDTEHRWFASPGADWAAETTWMSERTRAAYEAARGARFEYGEKPKLGGYEAKLQKEWIRRPSPEESSLRDRIQFLLGWAATSELTAQDIAAHLGCSDMVIRAALRRSPCFATRTSNGKQLWYRTE